jgi:hypothetical protein
MKSLRKGVSSQAIGLIPLLLFFCVDYHFSYILSFVVAVSFALLNYLGYRFLKRGDTYKFLLLPVSVTLFVYAILLFLQLEPLLLDYSVLVLEILLVVSLTCASLARRFIMLTLKRINIAAEKRSYINASLNEYYSVAQITQNLYTLHLFSVLVYFILPEHLKNSDIKPFLFQYAPIVIGVFVILYEQVRLFLIRKYLSKEEWFPVLNDNGKVIGRIARSISRMSVRKFYHPVVRVALVHKGMLYLAKRDNKEIVSPEALDYPFRYYVKYKQTFEDAALEAIASSGISQTPHYLVRYTLENKKVKHLVSVFAININSEEELEQFNLMSGKLWTTKQIEDNLGMGLFSEYFEKEFPYLQSIVLRNL